jgi:hypothetical protein
MQTKSTPAHDHDYVAHLEAAGLEVCTWPKCGATREAPDVEDCAVDVSPVEVVRERRAA